MMRSRLFASQWFILLSILVTGCLPSGSAAPPPSETENAGDTAPTPSEDIIATALAEPLEGVENTPTAVPTPEPVGESIDPFAPLSSTGPWLVVFTDTGMWVANADGSGALRWVSDLTVTNAAYAPTSLAPSGGGVAFMVAAGENYDQLALHLITLPSTRNLEITRLFNDENQPNFNSSPGDNSIEAARAMTEFNPFAWSPDGHRLAFIGGVSGPTADLYLYDLDSATVTRLTDGPTHGFQPIFSPDGKWIVHASARGFGTGAGYAMDTMWAAAVDGSEVKAIYTPQSADETVLGFVDDDQFAVYSWDAGCGPSALRLASIQNGDGTPITGYFSENGVALSPRTATALVTIDEFVADCNPDDTQGTLLVDLNNGTVRTISETAFSDPIWSPQLRSYFARTEDGAVQITPEGSVIPLAAPTGATPLVSPDGSMWAWVGDGYNGPTGIWISPIGGKPQLISDFGSDAVWSPDSKYLFYVDEGLLYRVDAMTGAVASTGAELGVYGIVSLAWAK
jgi:hypothetical protein